MSLTSFDYRMGHGFDRVRAIRLDEDESLGQEILETEAVQAILKYYKTTINDLHHSRDEISALITIHYEMYWNLLVLQYYLNIPRDARSIRRTGFPNWNWSLVEASDDQIRALIESNDVQEFLSQYSSLIDEVNTGEKPMPRWNYLSLIDFPQVQRLMGPLTLVMGDGDMI